MIFKDHYLNFSTIFYIQSHAAFTLVKSRKCCPFPKIFKLFEFWENWTTFSYFLASFRHPFMQYNMKHLLYSTQINTAVKPHMPFEKIMIGCSLFDIGFIMTFIMTDVVQKINYIKKSINFTSKFSLIYVSIYPFNMYTNTLMKKIKK